MLRCVRGGVSYVERSRQSQHQREGCENREENAEVGDARDARPEAPIELNVGHATTSGEHHTPAVNTLLLAVIRCAGAALRSRFRVFVNLYGAPSFVGGVAESFQWTLGALRLAGDADGAAVMNDLVGEVDPLALRDNLHQVLLDLWRVDVLR